MDAPDVHAAQQGCLHTDGRLVRRLGAGRNSDDGPWSFVTDGSLDADALRKRRPIRLNRFFGPFTETFLDVVADVG